MIFGLREVGGWDALMQAVPKEKLNMFLPLSDPEFPWLGILIASPIVGLWYWCTDQHIVQRCLAAKNEQEARRGTIFAAFLKLMPFFIFLIPGLIAYALHAQGKIQLDDTNAAFPVMVKSIMPVGLRGVLAGGLLAALMSSLASVYNACSTLYTIDIYKKSHPDASEKQLVKVGRIATAVIVLLGMAWIPLMGRIDDGLYNYLQSVQSYLAPPIAAVFLLGVFFKRLNAQGAYSSMVIGFILGMAKLTFQIFQNDLTPGSFWHSFATMNFLYFCIYLFVFSIAVLVIVSLSTPAPPEEKTAGLTFATTVAEDKAASRASWNGWDVALSVIVLVVILSIFAYFSPLGIAG
jgi:SSS family solute:Na+ symporter